MTPEERAELAREEARIAERFAALEAERDRLREQLAAFVPPGTLSAGETPALCGTCKDRLCVPGLPGCARCVAEQVERLREEERRQRETAEAASRGWRIEVAEVERLRAELAKTSDHRDYLHKRLEKVTKEANGRKEYGQRLRAELALWEATRPHVLWLRAELAETTHALTVTGEKVTAMRGQRDRAVAERDRLTRHAVRLRHAWDSARQRARGYRQAGEWVVAERDRLAEQVKRVREVAACLRRHEANLKERYDKATNDARATALLSSAALTGDAAHRIERALGGTEPGQ